MYGMIECRLCDSLHRVLIVVLISRLVACHKISTLFRRGMMGRWDDSLLAEGNIRRANERFDMILLDFEPHT